MNEQMTERQKLMLDLAARFLAEHIKSRGIESDTFSAHYALRNARYLVNGAYEEDTP